MQATNDFEQQDTAQRLRDLIQVAPNEFDTVNHARALQVATAKEDGERDDDERANDDNATPPSAITKLIRASYGGRP